ncbi:MAG TPA: 4Fe-4S binding protein, partial [Methanocorpusculum sp.]|nr:4Fe-4S binding protein [Methanocorpusculum sp.]
MNLLLILLKQLLNRPVTINFPAEPPKKFENTRGHIKFNESKCTSCTLCMKRCPSQAILVDRASKTWTIDRFKCIICGQCVELCKFEALSLSNEYSEPATIHERTVDTHTST